MSQSILITGCSSGIGLCAAETLLKKGYRVFATARKESDVEKLRELGLESLQLDVNDSTSIRNALATILEKTGGTLDAVFNNAGYVQPGAIEDLSRDDIRAQFETNVFGVMELTTLIIPIMRKQGHGRIIQNTSILGVVAMPYRGAYNASKFALEGFTNTLRQELKNTNIHVSIIAPGPIETKLQDNAHQHYVETLKGKQTIHTELYKEMEKFLILPPDKKHFITSEPDAVVKKLIHALESPNPSAHYFIGWAAQIFAFLRRILPDKLMDSIAIRSVRT
ncbi:MAG: SDR family NAD(P)-dependent oxidoreductase [Gammaproteobacteria bacterium]|nr:SDR family NAD(P)-dependent oxidoreductase [Gammaproteobacteria bacterium]